MNASPLICLTRVGLLEVLREPGVPALVPDVVLAEISGHGPNDPTIRAVRQASWLQVVPTPTIPERVRAWDLDTGESAVLTLALEQPGSMAVLDDLAARRCAQALALPLQGTLGLIVVAKELGMVPEVRPVLERLRQSGMYVSDRLLIEVLISAGESPESR